MCILASSKGLIGPMDMSIIFAFSDDPLAKYV